MNILKRVFLYTLKGLCYILILYPLYFISKFFPRDKKMWIFGSHNGTFSDNSKYLFWYVVDNHKDKVRAIWISSNKDVIYMLRKEGYEVYYKWEPKGLFFTLIGGVYIYSSYTSDINFWTSGGAIKFNLWHGIPLKKIEFDIKVGKLAQKYNSSFIKYIYMFFFPDNFQKPDFLLSTTKDISRILANAFRIPINKCLEFGYPRCEHFLWDKDKILEFVKQKDLSSFDFITNFLFKYSQVYIYMPTFREKGENDISKAINLEEINEICKFKNVLFLIKQHPSLKSCQIPNFSNIFTVPSKNDVYMILPFTDLLITDYSSVMFDYLLLKKPIILYQYDYNDYKNKERDFYFDPKNLEIGFRVSTYNELKTLLNTNLISSNIDFQKYWLNVSSVNQKILSFLLDFLNINNSLI